MPAPDRLPSSVEALTDKELEILRLLTAGHTVKSIAARLGRSEASINERLRDARRKTGIGSSRERSVNSSPGAALRAEYTIRDSRTRAFAWEQCMNLSRNREVELEPQASSGLLDVLIRAGVLIAHDYLDDGLSELDRLPHDASPSDRAVALMLRAEAAYHKGDEDTF